MGKLLAFLTEFFLKNGVQKILMGAGLSVVGYLAVVTAFKSAFQNQLDATQNIPTTLLNLLGIFGVDYVLSAFVSAAIFILTLNSGKLALRKK